MRHREGWKQREEMLDYMKLQRLHLGPQQMQQNNADYKWGRRRRKQSALGLHQWRDGIRLLQQREDMEGTRIRQAGHSPHDRRHRGRRQKKRGNDRQT